MRLLILILLILISFSASGQRRFDSLLIDKLLTRLPAGPNQQEPDENIIKTIQAIDKKFREISDTLYGYKSLKHTVFQTIFIEIKYLMPERKAFLKVFSDAAHYPQSKYNLAYFKNDTLNFLKYHLKTADFKNPYQDPVFTVDSMQINPLLFGDLLKTNNIIFDNRNLNIKIDSIGKTLKSSEKHKLFKYLEENFDNFSLKEKKITAQPVRLRYITFSEGRLIYAGIDIYGTHFLWTIDKTKNWDVVKVESLWVY